MDTVGKDSVGLTIGEANHLEEWGTFNGEDSASDSKDEGYCGDIFD